MNPSGRTALVTGGAARLGRTCALALADAGAEVVIHYRSSRNEAARTVRDIESRGGRARAEAADLADPGAAADLFRRAASEGRVDILVNNASVFPADDWRDVAVEDFRRQADLHTHTPFVLMRELARQGGEAVAVNMLDTRVADFDPKHLSYHLSKRGLFTLTRILAAELAPDVRVNAVAPGLILPPPGEDAAYLEKLRHTNPLNAVGSPEQIADALLYLVRADFVTGQVLYVDGGRHLKGNAYGL